MACNFSMAGEIVSFYELNIFLTSFSLVWDIETVQVYLLFTEEFTVDL